MISVRATTARPDIITSYPLPADQTDDISTASLQRCEGYGATMTPVRGDRVAPMRLVHAQTQHR
jgi:hypothetical protein